MMIVPLCVPLIPAVEELIRLGAPYVSPRSPSDYWLYAELFSSTCRVALEGDEVIGVVIAFRSQDHPDDIYVQDVMIHPDHRRRGIARALLEQVRGQATAWGCTRLYLTSEPENTGAHATWTALGFVNVAGDRTEHGVSVTSNYKGPGKHRAVYVLSATAADSGVDERPRSATPHEQLTHAVAAGHVQVVVCAASPARHQSALIVGLRARGWQVSVVATPSGADWLDRTAITQLTGQPVMVTNDDARDMALAEPDAVIVAPATFNTINSWAAGISDSLALSALHQAVGRAVPILVVPHVNAVFAANDVYGRSLHLLAKRGATVLDVDPCEGGCGPDQHWPSVLAAAEALGRRDARGTSPA